ncbi:MAG: 30S ribosomal protein S8 [Mesoaciditoga sp.]|uniref:30S ribosomal protein S8 n=1 Tax=Athalassotoga sp. TaxID=2022597 RepID=UPI000CCAB390|nr:MAG: 30S ribosomal protein S8 [Mesoaciditoga sp.]PMP79895.1 MAG: 30S ribosomal protein S8 [Mesoaciditoga sp.]HEU23689.1 30S ribosomal protein S8 [Mesoaciditoga lauensis]
MYTDTIADMLTRIRNANMVYKEVVDVPASNLKKAILDILKREGFIKDYKYIEDGKQGVLRIFMKYSGQKRTKIRTINSIVRVSHAGRRIYVSKDKLPVVNSGLGIAIISTSNPEKPIVTDKEARALGIGGEVIAYVW